jgi:hypothetical protein
LRPSISQAAQPIGLYLQLEEAPVMDVWAARDRVVAGAVARLAAEGTDVGALQEQVDALVTHVGDFASFNLQMIRTSEMAVELAGSLTDYVVVLALRHIIASELAEATQNAAEAVEAAVAAERDIVDAWQRTLRHIQLGQESAARAAFEEQAWTLQALLDFRTPGLSVGDVVSRQLGDLQFEGSATRTRSPQQEKTAPARRRPRRPGSPARPLRAGPTSGS